MKLILSNKNNLEIFEKKLLILLAKYEKSSENLRIYDIIFK